LLHGVKASAEDSTRRESILGYCLVWPLLLVKYLLQAFNLALKPMPHNLAGQTD